MLELPIEPYEEKVSPESIRDICEEPTDDRYIYLINGEGMCRGCVEEWLETQRISVDE